MEVRKFIQDCGLRLQWTVCLEVGIAKEKAVGGLRWCVRESGVRFQNQICKARDKMRSLKGKFWHKPAEDLRLEQEWIRKKLGAYPSLKFAGIQQGVKARRDNVIFPRRFQWQHLIKVGTSFEALPSRVPLTNGKPEFSEYGFWWSLYQLYIAV